MKGLCQIRLCKADYAYITYLAYTTRIFLYCEDSVANCKSKSQNHTK